MAAQIASKKSVAEFTYAGEKFKLAKTPSAYFVAELASTDDEDPKALGVIIDFFKSVLSPEDYKRFRALALSDDSGLEDGLKALMEIIVSVIEQSTKRPTESSGS